MLEKMFPANIFTREPHSELFFPGEPGGNYFIARIAFGSFFSQQLILEKYESP
jgi:hypothetical protein